MASIFGRWIAAELRTSRIAHRTGMDNELMEFQRSSGVLLHVSSLASYGGIGDLGPAAHEFVAFLAARNSTSGRCFRFAQRAMATRRMRARRRLRAIPYLISLEFLADWGWIEGARIGGLAGKRQRGLWDVEARKLPLLYEAAGNFLDRGPHDPKLAEAVGGV
jgi:4-alpha-glucanotransferase